MLTGRARKFHALCLSFTALFLLSTAAPCLKAQAAPGRGGADVDLERELATLMKQARGQRHRTLAYNATLARVARQRAYDMGTRNYFDHVNPDGLGPNYLVTRAGYRLPGFYSKRRSGNNIESIAAGSETPAEAWDNWMGSASHRAHLLGLTDFYAGQTEYGVGHAYVPGSRYKHYWVVIIAEPAGGRDSADEEEDDDEPAVEEEDDGESADEDEDSGGSGSDDTESSTCSGRRHLVRGADGSLLPASGYVWVSPDDPNDLRVKLMPGLVRTGDGHLRPAKGYRWVNPDDPNDLRVRRAP